MWLRAWPGKLTSRCPLVVSGLLAGAAATFELADRLEHGDFEWDLNTAMNLLDIASALLTFGVRRRVAVAGWAELDGGYEKLHDSQIDSKWQSISTGRAQ